MLFETGWGGLSERKRGGGGRRRREGATCRAVPIGQLEHGDGDVVRVGWGWEVGWGGEHRLFFLMHRSHSISFTRAQGIPEYNIGFGRGKGWECCHLAVTLVGAGRGACVWRRKPVSRLALSPPPSPVPLPPPGYRIRRGFLAAWRWLTRRERAAAGSNLRCAGLCARNHPGHSGACRGGGGHVIVLNIVVLCSTCPPC
jgi:hypothetical protein